MMPSLSLSFRPTPKFPTYCTRWFVYCAATFWYYFSKGGNRQQGNKGTRETAVYSQSCSPRPPPSPRRSLPLCHRDGRPGDTTKQTPQGDRLWGVFVFPPVFISSHLQESDKSEGRLSSSSSFVPCKIRERTIWYVKWARAGGRDDATALWEATSRKHSKAAVCCARGGCQSQKWDPVTDWRLNI